VRISSPKKKTNAGHTAMIEYILVLMFAGSGYGLVNATRRLSDSDRYSDMGTALFAVAFAVSLAVTLAGAISRLP